MSDGASFVQDASALLAHLLAEPGGDVVRDTLAEHAAVMSAVNWAEVLSRLASAGADPSATSAASPFAAVRPPSRAIAR